MDSDSQIDNSSAEETDIENSQEKKASPSDQKKAGHLSALKNHLTTAIKKRDEFIEKNIEIKRQTIHEITEIEINRKKLASKKGNNFGVSGYRLVLGYIGIFMMMIGALSLVSLIILVDPTLGTDFYTGEQIHTYGYEASFWWCILVPGIASLVIGFLLSLLILNKKKARLKGMEDIFLVFSVWIIAIFVFAMPFIFCRFVNSELSFTFTQAMFESTSGLTTTGLSVMTTDSLPKLLLFHRSLANFVGGVGLVLFMTSAVSDRSGLNIYLLEGHNDQLVPNIVKSARMIFIIYSVYVLVGTVSLLCCGCSPMDSICFSMAALSTGGLASHSESVSWFEMNLPYANYCAIEIVILILMILGSTNFVIHFYLWKRQFKKAIKHYEFLVFIGLMICVYPFFIYGMYQAFTPISTNSLESVGKAFRNGTFEFVSLLSTSGFSTLTPIDFPEAYANLPSACIVALIVLMAIGGQNGSTSGGIKQSRVALCFLNIKWSIAKSINRTEMVKTNYVTRLGNKVAVSEEETKEASNYAGLYFGFAFIGTMILCGYAIGSGSKTFVYDDGLQVYSLANCLFEIVSCLSGVGGSSGITAFASNNSQWGVLWLEMFCMFAGRLEVTIFLVSISRGIKLFRSRKNVFKKDQSTSSAFANN